MKCLRADEKDRIADAVRTVVSNIVYSGRLSGTGGTCVPSTLIGWSVLIKMGIKAIPFAGSLSWPIVKPEDDDGVSPTHFSFEYHAKAAVAALMAGMLPEMHCWMVTESYEVVDFTTFQLPKLCMECAGLTWRADHPPAYVWSRTPVAGVHYQPNVSASRLMLDFFRTMRMSGTVTLEDINDACRMAGVVQTGELCQPATPPSEKELSDILGSMAPSQHGKRSGSTGSPVSRAASLT